MTCLQDIDITPTRHTPTISVYEGRVVLSASACALLGLSDDQPRVRVKSDLNHRNRVYISRSQNDSGFHSERRKDGQTRRINCVGFSHKLALVLDGYGTYKICEDSTITDGGIVHYEIFFRKCREVGKTTCDCTSGSRACR